MIKIKMIHSTNLRKRTSISDNNDDQNNDDQKVWSMKHTEITNNTSSNNLYSTIDVITSVNFNNKTNKYNNYKNNTNFSNVTKMIKRIKVEQLHSSIAKLLQFHNGQPFINKNPQLSTEIKSNNYEFSSSFTCFFKTLGDYDQRNDQHRENLFLQYCLMSFHSKSHDKQINSILYLLKLGIVELDFFALYKPHLSRNINFKLKPIILGLHNMFYYTKSKENSYTLIMLSKKNTIIKDSLKGMEREISIKSMLETSQEKIMVNILFHKPMHMEPDKIGNHNCSIKITIKELNQSSLPRCFILRKNITMWGDNFKTTQNFTTKKRIKDIDSFYLIKFFSYDKKNIGVDILQMDHNSKL